MQAWWCAALGFGSSLGAWLRDRLKDEGQRWRVAIVLLLAVVLVSCGDRPSLVDAIKTAPAGPLVGAISEVAPPTVIQRLARDLDRYQPQVTIVSPRADDVLQTDRVDVKLAVTGLPIFRDERLGLGPHLRLWLDDQPYGDIYDLSQPIVLENLSAGTHTLRAIALRPWQESFKNEGAYAQSSFHLFARSSHNQPDADEPLLTYNEPSGTYTAGQPVLLDFYLTNAPLHAIARQDDTDEIKDWRIRATVNGETFPIANWQAAYLQGFKLGKNWVKLELVDEAGKPLNPIFNETVVALTIDREPVDDPVNRLLRGEIPYVEAKAITDPTYEPPAPAIEVESPVEVPPVVQQPIEAPTPEQPAPSESIVEPTPSEPENSELTGSESVTPELVVPESIAPALVAPESLIPESIDPEKTAPAVSAPAATDSETTDTAAPDLAPTAKPTGTARPADSQVMTAEPSDRTPAKAADVIDPETFSPAAKPEANQKPASAVLETPIEPDIQPESTPAIEAPIVQPIAQPIQDLITDSIPKAIVEPSPEPEIQPETTAKPSPTPTEPPDQEPTQAVPVDSTPAVKRSPAPSLEESLPIAPETPKVPEAAAAPTAIDGTTNAAANTTPIDQPAKPQSSDLPAVDAAPTRQPVSDQPIDETSDRSNRPLQKVRRQFFDWLKRNQISEQARQQATTWIQKGRTAINNLADRLQDSLPDEVAEPLDVD